MALLALCVRQAYIFIYIRNGMRFAMELEESSAKKKGSSVMDKGTWDSAGGMRRRRSRPSPVVGLRRGTCTAVLTHPSSSRHFVAVSTGRSDASAHPALVGSEKIEVGEGGGGGVRGVGAGGWNSVHFVEQILRSGFS